MTLTMPSASLRPVGRGVMFGLMTGLFLGGLGLLGYGLWALVAGPDCAGLTGEECALQREIAVTLGRMQLTFGAALALAGIAIFLWHRGRQQPRSET